MAYWWLDPEHELHRVCCSGPGKIEWANIFQYKVPIILLSPRALPSILPIHILRCPSSLPPIPCNILRLLHSPAKYIRPPSSVHDQLHRDASHIPMRTRPLLPLADMRELPGSIPQLALQRVLPTVCRALTKFFLAIISDASIDRTSKRPERPQP